MPDTVVLISRRVLQNRKPIFFIARSASGQWEFHPEDHLGRPRSDLVQSTLAEVVAHDSAVETVLDHTAVPVTATILQPPQNFPWACEMKVGDPDGHVLRFGSDPTDVT